MGIDIITLYKECPDAVVNVKVGDIIEANRSLISEAIEQYEKSRQELDMSELMTGQEVEKFLGISKTTRERWSKPDAFGQPPLLPKNESRLAGAVQKIRCRAGQGKGGIQVWKALTTHHFRSQVNLIR